MSGEDSDMARWEPMLRQLHRRPFRVVEAVDPKLQREADATDDPEAMAAFVRRTCGQDEALDDGPEGCG